MADFFKVLQKMSLSESQGGIPTFLSTHPDPGDRYNDVNKEATDWQTQLNLGSYKVNRDSYLQMINGLIYGEDPKHGYVEGNTFYYPERKFKFSFPSGWTLANSPLQVTITPSDQKALMLFTLSNQKTLEAAVDTTIAQYRLTLQGSKRVTVNGLPAIMIQCKQVSQDQSTGATQTNMVLSYFISHGGLIYVFHGVSTEADFNNYSGTMDSSMTTFSNLSDPSKINVKPKRIQVVTVQRSGTLSDAFVYYRVPQKQYNELALLNNIELTEKVQVGKLIKIIGE
jgi:predicted Zn-dependent protease